MEDQEFEELTKAMAEGQSRRRTLKVLGVGVLSGLAGVFGRGGDTDAKRKRKGKDRATSQGYPTTTTTKYPTTTTKYPTTTTKYPTTTTKYPTTTTKYPTTTTKKPEFCGHSTGLNGGCKGACTSAGFTGNQCNVICGNGQFRGACPVGQGNNNPCCNVGYCKPNNFVPGSGGNPVYTGPTSGCS